MGYIGNEPTIGHFPVQTNLVGAPSGTYTLTNTPANAGAIEVSVQGVLQPTTSYSVSGTTLTMAGVTTGIPIFIRYLGETLSIPTPGDGTVTEAKLAVNAVTTGKIAAGAVGTTDIANDAVTGAKLNPALVAGDVIYADGTDTINRLAKGTAGQVLTMNGGATAPSWADAGGGGNRVFIKQIVASADASIDFIDGTASVVLDNTYKLYEIDIINMNPSANTSVYGRLYQVSGDRPITGSSYTGGEEYSYTNADTTFGYRKLTAGTAMRLGWIRSYSGSAAVAQYSLNGKILIWNPSATGKFCHVECSLVGHHSDGTFHRVRSYWYNTDTTPNTNMDGIKLYMASGTITTGYFNLYGIKDS